jgi:hypothetical protein
MAATRNDKVPPFPDSVKLHARQGFQTTRHPLTSSHPSYTPETGAEDTFYIGREATCRVLSASIVGMIPEHACWYGWRLPCWTAGLGLCVKCPKALTSVMWAFGNTLDFRTGFRLGSAKSNTAVRRESIYFSLGVPDLPRDGTARPSLDLNHRRYIPRGS